MSSDRIERARSIASPTEAVEVYAAWAESYDDDVFDSLGFTGTERIADLLAEHVVDRDVPVLDLGCGTGAAGVRLRRHGFTTIDGIDISPEMLAVAATKDAYRHLVAGDLLAPIDLPSGSYGASVSAGTFTSGHVGPDALAEIVRLLRAGAVVAWVVGPAMWPAFEPGLAAAGLDVVHATSEPIRRDSDDHALMVIARR